MHRELFQFDIVATDDTLYEAVTSSRCAMSYCQMLPCTVCCMLQRHHHVLLPCRWLCLASVQAGVSAQQEEQLAGFAMSAMGKAQDFNDGVGAGCPNHPLERCAHSDGPSHCGTWTTPSHGWVWDWLAHASLKSCIGCPLACVPHLSCLCHGPVAQPPTCRLSTSQLHPQHCRVTSLGQRPVPWLTFQGLQAANQQL